jgi:hypothetical protein
MQRLTHRLRRRRTQRRVLAMLVLALLLAVVPTAAQAKGATGATISGGGPGGLPGGPINLKGDGEPGSGTDLANLAEAAGVWALLFEDGPGGELTAAPTTATADRGPRYTITWVFPNGAGAEDKVRQSVWPYAAGGPLTFMASGQPVLNATTKGGWFQAADDLRQSLIALGLPSREPLATSPATTAAPTASAQAGSAQAGSAPAEAASGQAPTAPDPAPAVWPRVAAGLALLLAVAGGAMYLRRRSSPGAATTP